MKKGSMAACSILCFLIGVILGFLISPAKQGFGNNVLTQNYYSKEEKELSSKD